MWIAHPFWRSRLSFSALQRAEIAENGPDAEREYPVHVVSVLFNEPKLLKTVNRAAARSSLAGFSALQRAEIAENVEYKIVVAVADDVSVLFNEPKLLKTRPPLPAPPVSQIPIPARRRS